MIATQRGVVLSPHDDGDILKSDFASLDAASDLQATADLLAVVGSYFASLDAAFNLYASDRLVVLQLHSASFYVCLDSHLATLLYCTLVKFNLSW